MQRLLTSRDIGLHGRAIVDSEWHHPGGKLRELGAKSLSDGELLAIIVSVGIKGRSALDIANEVLQRFGSLEGLCNQPLDRLLSIRGLSDVKITRIAGAYELARRLSERARNA